MVLLAQIPEWLTGILIALFLFVCLLMILVVLIQRPAGGGLSGAFGSGAGSGQTAFGAKTGDALTIATVTVFFVYLVFAVGLNFAARTPENAGGGAPAAVAPAGGATGGETEGDGATPAGEGTPAPGPGGAEGGAEPGVFVPPQGEARAGGEGGGLPPGEQPVEPPAEPAGEPNPGQGTAPEPGAP